MLTNNCVQVLKAIVIAIVTSNLVCDIFAHVTLPGYIFSDIGFSHLNSHTPAVPTISDQDYFISPEHDSVSHDDKISIFYQARFAPGFGANVAATTFGRSIYMRANQASNTVVGPLA